MFHIAGRLFRMPPKRKSYVVLTPRVRWQEERLIRTGYTFIEVKEASVRRWMLDVLFDKY